MNLSSPVYAMGQLKKGKSKSDVAVEIGVTPRDVRRLWAEFRDTGSLAAPLTRRTIRMYK